MCCGPTASLHASVQTQSPLPQLFAAQWRDGHHTAVFSAFYPVLSLQMFRQRSAQCAAQVVAPLGPVQAAAGKLPAARAGARNIDAQCGEAFCAPGREFKLFGRCVGQVADQPALVQQQCQQAGAQAAGQVVITVTRLANRFGRPGRFGLAARGYPHQRFDQLRDMLRRQPEILVPALGGQGQHAVIEQAPEVRRGGGRRDAGAQRQLLGSQCAAFHQQRQHPYAAGITHSRCEAGEVGFCIHALIIGKPLWLDKDVAARDTGGLIKQKGQTMAQYTADIVWERGAQDFLDGRYSRRHLMRFDGGAEVAGSSSPHSVPLPMSDAAGVDPEEAFVAALSACHMLWFLAIAGKRKFCVDRYADAAVGVMARNEEGKMAMTLVTLRPEVLFSGELRPTREQLDQLHHQAHEECFIANSVRTEARCEPVYRDG